MKKKIISLVAVLCLMAAPLYSSFDQPQESHCYRTLLVMTSESDWTIVRLLGGHILTATYDIVEGDTIPECECWCDPHLNLIGMTKKQFDTSLVKIDVKIILHLKEDLNIVFEIQKGDIKYTTLDIYNYNGKEPVFLETVTNDANIPGDPENTMEFTVDISKLTAKGPLQYLVSSVPKLVWAFYYPWYHKQQWHTSKALIDTPLVGAHDSSGLDVIELHIKQAKSARIDGFIVSWWGKNDYADQNLKTILYIADKLDFKITIYLESLQNGPRSEEDLKKMFLSFYESYGEDQRYYRINGDPVIFVWAVESHPPSSWEDILSAVEDEGYTGVYIAMAGQPDYLEIFDGLHLYGTVGVSDLSAVYERLSTSCSTYGYFNDEPSYIWAATVCPGYDDRKIPGREGLYQPRDDGEYYLETFEAAVNSSPDWLLITSFNEWWENTHIEPSMNYGFTYLNLTAQVCSAFKELDSLAPLLTAHTLFGEALDLLSANSFELAKTKFESAKEIYDKIGYSEKSLKARHYIEKCTEEIEKQQSQKEQELQTPESERGEHEADTSLLLLLVSLLITSWIRKQNP